MRIPALFLLTLTASLAVERPNVLWITLEDTSPHFIGCYGDKAAHTPNIDRLAARGIRFDRAFANAPVCSSARSTIITGALNETLGTGNHRSAFPLPDRIKGFPTFLRGAGYYTTNNAKTDYATSSAARIIKESWDECSGKAGWWNRKPDQPFFAVFNQEDCHQSRTMTQPYPWYRTNVFKKLNSTANDWGQNTGLEKRKAILHAADLASRPEVNPAIFKLLHSEDPVITYWAASALRANPDYQWQEAEKFKPSYPPAAIEFAAASLRHGDPAAAATLSEFALSKDPNLRLQALLRIQDLGNGAVAFKETLEKATKGGSYDTRCAAEVALHLIDGRKLSY